MLITEWNSITPHSVVSYTVCIHYPTISIVILYKKLAHCVYENTPAGLAAGAKIKLNLDDIDWATYRVLPL